MKYSAPLLFVAIIVVVIVFGICNSLNNEKIEVSEVDDILLIIKSKQNAEIDKSSVVKLNDWKLRLIDLRKSIETENQEMSRKEFLELCDSIDGYIPVKMSDEEKERLRLDFQRDKEEIVIQDSVISEMTVEKFEEMFGCKPDPELL